MRPSVIKSNVNESQTSISEHNSAEYAISIAKVGVTEPNIMHSDFPKNEHCPPLPQIISPVNFLSTSTISNSPNVDDIDEPMTCGNPADDAPVDLNTLDNIDLDFPLNVSTSFAVEENILNLEKNHPQKHFETSSLEREKYGDVQIKGRLCFEPKNTLKEEYNGIDRVHTKPTGGSVTGINKFVN